MISQITSDFSYWNFIIIAFAFSLIFWIRIALRWFFIHTLSYDLWNSQSSVDFFFLIFIYVIKLGTLISVVYNLFLLCFRGILIYFGVLKPYKHRMNESYRNLQIRVLESQLCKVYKAYSFVRKIRGGSSAKTAVFIFWELEV